MRALGIDIGEDSIKIVELVQNKKQVYISAVFEKKLSPQISDHDREIEAIEFARQILSQIDASSKRVVMGLKQDHVTVRKKDFPFSDRLKIQKSLSFEMEEDIPFDPDLCLFDAKVIHYEGSSAQILAIAAPKSHIEKVLSLAGDFNVEPYSLSVDGLAHANLLEHWDQAPPQKLVHTSAIALEEVPIEQPLHRIDITLNLGHKKTLLCAQIDGRVVFVRSLLWGADYIIQDLVRKLQVPYLEAQKILQTQAQLLLIKSGANFEESQLASIIEKSLRELVRDLQMSFLELQSEFHGEIKSIQITGGLSLLPHLGAHLTQQLEIPCNAISLVDAYIDPQHLPEITSNVSPSLESMKARYATAVGLALEAFKKPRNPALQFMKGEFVSQNSPVAEFWSQWGGLVKVISAVLVLFFVWGYFREDFSALLAEKGAENLKQQAKTVARLPKKQANESGVKKYISENKKRAQEFRQLAQVAQMNSALDVLKKVSENAPGKELVQIDVKSFTVKDDLVTLSGYANSPREVTLLSQRLSSLSLNSKVSEEQAALPAIANRVAFALSFRTDRGLTK